MDEGETREERTVLWSTVGASDSVVLSDRADWGLVGGFGTGG